MENKLNGMELIDNVDIIKAHNTENTIYFNFSYSALKLLGKNLYNNAANAISELVANALDAKAKEVYVYIDMSDKKHSVIEILDSGSGMDYDDLADKYVWIGRNKREDADLTSVEKKSMMGRKGIGKLAALYLSDKYYILTKTADDEIPSQWEVNLKKYKDSEFPHLDKINESVILINQEIWSRFNTGTAIKLENVDLTGTAEKKIESLRRVFADFYLIDMLESKIFVAVKMHKDDNVAFKPVEKKIAYKNFYALFDNSKLNVASKMSKEIAFTWLSPYKHIAEKPRKTMIIDKVSYPLSGKFDYQLEEGISIEKEYELKGWIAAHATIEPKNAVDENFIRNNVYQPNRLRIYVRNKLAVADYFTISPSTQTMANYIEGEITFDILDDDDLPDIATSSRQDFLEDDRITLLTSLLDPILKKLFSLRNKLGNEISEENKAYTQYLLTVEEEKRKAEEAARVKAEKDAEEAQKAKVDADRKRQQAEDIAVRERKRSQYLLNVSNIEDKNIMNSVHSIYNMSHRVKENLDEINISGQLSGAVKKKLEKASVSNQRILSVSKLISKAGRIVDDNDAVKTVDLTSFVKEYVNDVISCVYDEADIKISCLGDLDSSFIIPIKPLSFIMMLDNLIGNAIKATAKELSIIIDNSSPNEFLIVFKDNGCGLNKMITDKNRLFEFGVTTTNGSGLGLYYAQKQMRNLHGEIDIQVNKDQGIAVVLSWKK